MRLETSGLGVRYGSREAVRSADLVAQPGEVLAVLGPNGCGKTSLLRALAGHVAHQGAVLLDGRPRSADAAIGFMPQDNALRAALTAFEVVLLGRLRSLRFRVSREDLTATVEALEELGIGALGSRRIGELSGGQRQLVFLAQVLAGEPRVLLLDEPTSALDIAHQMRVLALIGAITRRRGLTTLVVLHDLNAACRFADQVAIMSDGRIIAKGEPTEVIHQPTIERVFGVEVAIMDGPDGRPVVVPLRAHLTNREGVPSASCHTADLPSISSPIQLLCRDSDMGSEINEPIDSLFT